MEKYKYNSFKDYLVTNYYDILAQRARLFLIEENKQNSEIHLDDINIQNMKILELKFTKSDLEQIEFTIYFSVEYYFVQNCNITKCLIPRKQYYFRCNMKGSFYEGFKLRKNKIERINHVPFKEKITNDLVHIIRKDEMELYATKFLKYYCPEALKKPMPLNITKILSEKGVEWYSAPLISGVLGKTYFADDVAIIYDENKNPKRIKVKRGTILINTSKLNERGDGALRNTIVHEAVHWFYHNNYFGLRHLLNNKNTCSICYRNEKLIENDDIKWMEMQARSLSPKILLPQKMFLQKFKELYKKYKDNIYLLSDMSNYKNIRNAEILRNTIIHLSKFFDVSKQLVKYRLIELGYFEADGVINYNTETKKYYKSFAFSKGKLKEHQTFNISKESYLDLISKNTNILEDIKTKKLIYMNGLLVVNNPKYIENNNLTNYALNHVDECCLIFNIKSNKQNVYDNICFYLCADGIKKIENQVDIEQYSQIIKQADENLTHFELHRKNLPSTFGETIEYHCKKTRQSYEWIADKCNITSKTLRALRYEMTDNIKLIHILKFGIGLKLSQPYIQDLINKSGHSMCRISKSDNILLACATTFQRIGLVKTYEILKMNNQEEILQLTKPFIEKYIKKK